MVAKSGIPSGAEICKAAPGEEVTHREYHSTIKGKTHMGKWRDLFEAELPPVAQRPYRMEYDFGPPATTDQVAAAETALKVQFPADVREMLSEFNGIWSRSHFDDGREIRQILFLDLQHMTVELPQYF